MSMYFICMIMALFGNVVGPGSLWWTEIAHLDHIGGFLSYHDCRNVRVACGDCRHDTCVDDSELWNAINAKLWIDDGHWIG